MLKFVKHIISITLFICIALLSISNSHADRLKDLTSISGVRDNPLVGYGIVVGLAGSGDGNSGLLLQSMQTRKRRLQLI